MTKRIELKNISADPPKEAVKKDIKNKTDELAQEIAELQEKLFASKKQSILIVLQGMDASGKSSTISSVFKYVNPMGIHTKSFKKPTDEEFAHDFLWRVHPHTPAKGMISIFDRSYYEEVLIQRVHNWVSKEQVYIRYKLINSFEQLVTQESSTLVLKFYLHISFEQQEKELRERIEDPTKHWKHNDQDWEERKFWDDYMLAYEDVFEHCSPEIPWNIVPANKSWYKKYLVAKTLRNELRALDLHWPDIEIQEPK